MPVSPPYNRGVEPPPGLPPPVPPPGGAPSVAVNPCKELRTGEGAPPADCDDDPLLLRSRDLEAALAGARGELEAAQASIGCFLSEAATVAFSGRVAGAGWSRVPDDLGPSGPQPASLRRSIAPSRRQLPHSAPPDAGRLASCKNRHRRAPRSLGGGQRSHPHPYLGGAPSSSSCPPTSGPTARRFGPALRLGPPPRRAPPAALPRPPPCPTGPASGAARDAALAPSAPAPCGLGCPPWRAEEVAMQEAEGLSRDEWPEVLPAWTAAPWAPDDSDGGSAIWDSDSTILYGGLVDDPDAPVAGWEYPAEAAAQRPVRDAWHALAPPSEPGPAREAAGETAALPGRIPTTPVTAPGRARSGALTTPDPVDAHGRGCVETPPRDGEDTRSCDGSPVLPRPGSSDVAAPRLGAIEPRPMALARSASRRIPGDAATCSTGEARPPLLSGQAVSGGPAATPARSDRASREPCPVRTRSPPASPLRRSSRPHAVMGTREFYESCAFLHLRRSLCSHLPTLAAMRRASLRCLVDGVPSPLGPRGEAWLVPGSLRALRDCYLPQWAGTSADFEGAGDLEDPVGCRIRPPAGWSFTATVTVLDPGPGLPAAAFRGAHRC